MPKKWKSYHYVKEEDGRWYNSLKCKYFGIEEVAAILKRRTALTTQPSQLCVDSGTLAYKNANLFDIATRLIFD